MPKNDLSVTCGLLVVQYSIRPLKIISFPIIIWKSESTREREVIIEVEKFIFEHNNTSSAGEKLMTDLTTDYLSKLDFDHSVLPLVFFQVIYTISFG